ncbi:MAG: class II histone deacetylase [Mesorhizobium sp.]|nr:MAG: class II histone deacetylase [Mesorhizobium sp.]
MKTGFLWHEYFAWHSNGVASGNVTAGGYVEPGMHFENPATKRRLRNLLEVTGILDELKVLPTRLATDEELLRVHDGDYLQKLKQMSDLGFGDAGEFTPLGKGSFEIARRAAGACIVAADAVLDRVVRNAYVLCRPPGHHAERARGRGFCLLANASIAVEHLRKVRGVKRIAMVDWDVHHGNGAQSIYYTDPDVLTISVHQDRLYPVESGSLEETGEGEGRGTCLNIPLPGGSGHEAYVATLARVVVPALEKFEPEIIIVPSGFDASALDPLGRQQASSDTYRAMTGLLMEAAERICQGRLLMTHEGGYSEAYVPWCGLAVMEELSGIRTEASDPFLDWVGSIGGHELKPHEDAVLSRAAALIKDIPSRETRK